MMRLSVDAVRPHYNDKPCRSGQSWTFWRLGVVAILGALLVITQSTNYTHHFHAHVAKHSILRNLQAQPALRFTFELKRKAMYVHGASTFDVVATPVSSNRQDDDRSMAYNGIASFEEDGDVHEYSLVDGTTYYTRRRSTQSVLKAEAGCLPSGSVPPIESVLNAIETAATATYSDSLNDLCPYGSVMVFQFAGEDFVLCSRQSRWSWFQEDNGFQILGKHLNIRIKYEQSVPIIVAPHVSTEELISCGKVQFGDRITPSLTSLLTRSFFEWSHRSLRAEIAEFAFFDKAFDKILDIVTDDDCRCKGAPRPCVFVAGLSSDVDLGLTDNDPQCYFGENIKEHTPCCSSRKYLTLATKQNKWYDPAFQQHTIDLLLNVSSTSDSRQRIVKDTIIIGHSMANLLLAGAIADGAVTLDASTSWIAASAPMMGSMGSNFIQDMCNGGENELVDSIIDLLGKCPVKIGELSLAYQDSNFSSPLLDKAYKAAQAAYAANVDAVICSKSFTGLVTVRAAVYALAGAVIPHHSRLNDGIVEYSSCTMGLPLESFSASFKSSRYITELNHVDTSFRNGDGLFSDAKKPLRWLECLL